MSMKGIEQGRANFAFKCAKEGAELPKKKEYKSYVKKIPMLIKTNGLGNTLAFMMSKKGTYLEIGEQITKWLKEDKNKILDTKTFKIDTFEKLVENIVEIESTEYRALTVEVLSFFNWLRRFADGLIEDDKNS